MQVEGFIDSGLKSLLIGLIGQNILLKVSGGERRSLSVRQFGQELSHKKEAEMNVQELAKESDVNRTKGSTTKRVCTVPITVLVLVQLIIALSAITLGYISFSSTTDITTVLTANLIQLVAKESCDGVTAALKQVVIQTNLINSDPAIDTIVQYHYTDFSVPQANFSRTLVHNMMENPIFSSESFVSPSNVINNYLVIRVTFHPNLTATQTLAFTPGIGMARVSCASAFVQSGDLLCYARLYQSMASGQVMYARAVNTTTGEDIGNGRKYTTSGAK
ncbi:hypothetical protein HDU83_003197 [Entophlyctis luteolus]|nr:hypothetical protein HDU83_003197 [Entophlyctis luteolus]